MMISPLDLPVSAGLGPGAGAGSVDVAGFVLDLLGPRGLPVYFGAGALLVAGSAKPTDGEGTTTTGGGSGIVTADADGSTGASAGGRFD